MKDEFVQFPLETTRQFIKDLDQCDLEDPVDIGSSRLRRVQVGTSLRQKRVIDDGLEKGKLLGTLRDCVK